jgi:hypothetical protein
VVASFWTSKEHVRSYFDWLAAENGIHTYEDWYKTLNIDFIRANHGKGILTHYGDSWITAIMSTYPGEYLYTSQLSLNDCRVHMASMEV